MGPSINDNQLGPGSYETKTRIGEGPHYTISLKREVSPGNRNPGPADYQPDDSPTREKAPQWKFSNNQGGNHEGPLANSNSLGPG